MRNLSGNAAFKHGKLKEELISFEVVERMNIINCKTIITYYLAQIL